MDSPRSTERLPQSSGDQGTHAGPSDFEFEISRAQRALDDANATLHRREERRRHDDERRRREDEALDQARAAAREASRAVERARQAIATSTAARATPPPARPLGVASQETRPGDDAFMSGSVQHMAITPRVEFSADLAEAVVAAATVLLTSKRRSSFRAQDLSVRGVWARRDNNSAFGQMRQAPTLALVKALRLAHDDAPDPVLWPASKEALEGRRATKHRRGGSRNRGDRNRGGGSSEGGGGETEGNGENGRDGGHDNRRGGDNGGGNAGGASDTGGGPERRQRSNQARTNRSGGRSSGGGTGARRNGARGPSAWEGSSTLSRSSSSSNTDRGEETVVAVKRQVTPSLRDIASSAEQLRKLTVSGDRTNPFSSDLAHERTAELAAAAALAKSTLDDSVWRAYVKHSYKDVSRLSVLPFPVSLHKSDGTQQLTRSVRSAMTDILMRCDDRCQEGVRAPTWVPGWIHPLRLVFNRAITPNRPTTARITTLIDDSFGQV